MDFVILFFKNFFKKSMFNSALEFGCNYTVTILFTKLSATSTPHLCYFFFAKEV